MLQPHSFLWHYLWVGPHVLQAALAIFLWRLGLHRQFPAFTTYLVFGAVEELTLYTMDVIPLGSVEAFWLVLRVGSIIEAVIVIGVIGELFRHLLRSRPVIARLGTNVMRGTVAALILLATVTAAYTLIARREPAFVSRAYVLLQSSYMVDCGLVLFLFLFAAYNKSSWDRRDFGIAIGFGIVWCEHMAGWAAIASGAWASRNHLFGFLNMATYHLCVLIWCYYLLVPQKKAITSAVALPENDLAIWNRELERLLQR